MARVSRVISIARLAFGQDNGLVQISYSALAKMTEGRTKQRL